MNGLLVSLQTVENKFGIEGASSRRSSRFLARGHLAPDADYPLLGEQDATYYYSNVVPQWQSINNANWKVRQRRASVAEHQRR